MLYRKDVSRIRGSGASIMGKLWEQFKDRNETIHGIKLRPLIIDPPKREDDFMSRFRVGMMSVIVEPHHAIITNIDAPIEFTKHDWQNYPRKKKKIVKASMLRFNELLRKGNR